MIRVVIGYIKAAGGVEVMIWFPNGRMGFLNGFDTAECSRETTPVFSGVHHLYGGPWRFCQSLPKFMPGIRKR